uniref:sensor histidine kinase n=1 Tax=Thaumasiovibrio occultus TaxID=1891184 RepID=UPI000B3582C8|nr:ATP-binding protein [Thaumasiovibrio occultus]
MIKRTLLLGLLIIGIALAIVIGLFVEQRARSQLAHQLNQDITSVAETINNELEQFSRIPVLLAQDPRIISAFTTGLTADKLNPLLDTWQDTLEADVIYLLNLKGNTIASSNYQNDDSFVGANFSFRPYFQQALLHERGRYFALGIHSQRRGYFFSAAVFSERRIVGVITIKVDLSKIEELWQLRHAQYLITDEDGTVFYSSNPAHLYQSMLTLSPEAKDQIIASRQYGKPSLYPLTTASQVDDLYQANLAFRADNNVYVNHLNQVYAMPEYRWRVHGMLPETQIWQRVFMALSVYAVIYILASLALLSWFETYRAKNQFSVLNAKLEQLVTKRTQRLQQRNQQLKETLQQYEQSQQTLKQTEKELVQTAKLALLGELSASINHEINQPLGAMRTYTENAQRLMAREDYQQVNENLTQILALNEMISEIIARLKVFAKKQQQATPTSELSTAIRSAVSIVNSRLLKRGILLKLDLPTHSVMISADRIQIEQVIINLLTNAEQALQHEAAPQIGIDIGITRQHAIVSVWDNGPGISDPLAVFEPFYTTKSEGLGLGLTISRRIVEDFTGRLVITPNGDKGSRFEIHVPLAMVDEEVTHES